MIDAMWMLGVAAAIIAAVITAFLAVLGWMGNKLALVPLADDALIP